MTRGSRRDEERATALLGELRVLRLSVNVSGSVLEAVRGLPVRGRRLTGREIAAGGTAAVAACLVIAVAIASLPAGHGPWTAALLPLARAAARAASACNDAFLSIVSLAGRTGLALLQILALPAGRGQAPFYALTALSLFCLATAAAAGTALLWREWRQPMATTFRRLP